MTRDEVRAIVINSIREETENPQLALTDETVALDVPGWDSLGHVRIVMSIGMYLDADIDIKSTYKARDVGELVDIAVAAVGA